MTSIIQKAPRGIDTALPFSRQQSLQPGDLVLWESHLKKTYGLPSGFASAYAALFELEAMHHGR